MLRNDVCLVFLSLWKSILHKQPSRGVVRKRCFENTQQIYRRIPMPKCDFNKVVLLKSHFGMGKFAAYFQNTFSLEHLLRTITFKVNNRANHIQEITEQFQWQLTAPPHKLYCAIHNDRTTFHFLFKEKHNR